MEHPEPPRRPQYQVLTDEFVAQVQSQPYLDAFDLCQIAAWKSARSVAMITMNDRSSIESATASAKAALRSWLEPRHNVITTETDWDAFLEDVRTAVGSKRHGSGLLSLAGVNYPLASAVLRVWNREAFPVLDRHAALAVRQAHPGALPASPSALHTGRDTAPTSGHWQRARTLAAALSFTNAI